MTWRRALGLVLALALVVLPTPLVGAAGDRDGDGVENDNCPSVYNPGQENVDGDAKGDACDDSDGDGLTDAFELERTYVDPVTGAQYVDNQGNPLRTQWDNKHSDGDAWSDGYEVRFRRTMPVDADTDDDGVRDDRDNCPTTENPDQQDLDRNGVGDACQLPAASLPDTGGVIPDDLIPDVDLQVAHDALHLATDGHVLIIRQVLPTTFMLQVRTTGDVPVALDLPTSTGAGPPVHAYLLAPDGAALFAAAAATWEYLPLSKQLKITISTSATAAAGVVLAVPPLGYESPSGCPSIGPDDATCNLVFGYFNPGKTLLTLDALDAEPFPVLL